MFWLAWEFLGIPVELEEVVRKREVWALRNPDPDKRQKMDRWMMLSFVWHFLGERGNGCILLIHVLSSFVAMAQVNVFLSWPDPLGFQLGQIWLMS